MRPLRLPDLVLRRAAADRSTVLAVLVNVIILCTLVVGLTGSLENLERSALRDSLAVLPPEEAIVSVVAGYDDEDPSGQDAAVRTALRPVISVAGGTIVRRSETVSYDVAGADGSLMTFTAVDGADDRLPLAAGRLPRDSAGSTIEAAAPASSARDLGISVGDRLELVSRSHGGHDVVVSVVGLWRPPNAAAQRWLGDMAEDVVGEASAGQPNASDDLIPLGALLVDQSRFTEVAGAGSSTSWRAVPDLQQLRPEQIGALAQAAASAEQELAAVAERRSASFQADNRLTEVLETRAQALVRFRSLILVPVVLLMLLGAASLALVAALLADSRRPEEQLLRSRGASAWQIALPSWVEAVALSAIGAAVAPWLAVLTIRADGAHPTLDSTTWVASGIAALVCAISLTAPSLLRMSSTDRAHSLSLERHRRAALAVLFAVVLLVLALGGLAAAQLQRHGGLSATSRSAGVDPLLVASPALLTLAVSSVLVLSLLPVVARLAAGTVSTRGLAAAVGARFTARAPTKAVPLALVVTLATASVWFAVVQVASQAEARATRAAYDTGAELRVTAAPDVRRSGTLNEQRELRDIAGVQSVTAVYRSAPYVDELAAEMLIVDLTDVQRTFLHASTAAGSVTAEVASRLTSRPWRGVTGVALPAGTRRLEVALDADADRWESAQLLMADGEGNVTIAPAKVSRSVAQAVWRHGLPRSMRLVGVRTDLAAVQSLTPPPPPRGGLVARVTVDGTTVQPSGQWRSTPGGVFAMLEGAQLPRGSVPAAVAAPLDDGAGIETGDLIEIDVAGVPVQLEVIATLPHLATVPDGRIGILVDSGTSLPALAAGGFEGEPNEWWLSAQPGRADAIAIELRGRPDLAASVLTRADSLRALEKNPTTGGAGMTDVLVLTAIGAVLIGAVAACSVMLLRRRERAGQAHVLSAVGATPGAMSRVLGWEYAFTAGAGALSGMAVGGVVAALTLTAMTLSPSGQPLTPTPTLQLPWLGLLVGPAVLIAVPLLLVVWLTRTDVVPRRLRLSPRRGAS